MISAAGLLPKLAVFAIAAVLGGSVAFVAASALNRPRVTPTATEAPEVVLTAGGTVAAFDLLEAQSAPTVLEGLPPDDLSAASAALIDEEPPPGTNPLGFPRVPPVTQFDGGPFEGSNCTLAAGAMLARLGFGIVTSGSILRTLQDDQSGGTGLNDLQTALFRGYGVQFRTGAINANQLKRLLAAGYGAVIQGDYGEIPVGLRLQPSFDDPHAIYLDGYYPGDPATPEAYYVVDPIGRGSGYDGDWWPASVVDAFGRGFGPGNRILAAWVFPPGGVPPEVVGPEVLPIPTEPPEGPDDTPSTSAAPGGSAEPPDDEAGDVDPPEPPVEPPFDGPIVADVGTLNPYLEICLIDPPPASCPTGVEGVFEIPLPPLVDFSLGPEIDVRFVDSDQAGIALIGFTVEPAAPVDVVFWQAGGPSATVSGPTSMAVVDIGGSPTIVARLDVFAGTTYQFQVVAGDGIFATESPVGTFTTGPGLSAFDVALAPEEDPEFRLGTGFSPYVHLAEGAFAPPLLEIVDDEPADACLDIVVDFGGSPYCPTGSSSAQDVCPTAVVTYALSGIEASGVIVRAFPTVTGEIDDDPTLTGILEAGGPGDAGEIEIGCLASGLSYSVTIDAVGDADGILGSRLVDVP